MWRELRLWAETTLAARNPAVCFHLRSTKQGRLGHTSLHGHQAAHRPARPSLIVLATGGHFSPALRRTLPIHALNRFQQR